MNTGDTGEEGEGVLCGGGRGEVENPCFFPHVERKSITINPKTRNHHEQIFSLVFLLLMMLLLLRFRGGCVKRSLTKGEREAST